MLTSYNAKKQNPTENKSNIISKTKTKTTIPTPIDTTTFQDEKSDDDDILNENIPEKMKFEAMDRAAHITSEYKTNLHNITHPNSSYSWLIHTIRKIVSGTDKITSPHKYTFINTREADKANTIILKKRKYDFTKALRKEKGTILEPGSEFRPQETLEPLLQDHEHWETIRDIITNGVSYSLEDLPEHMRKEDLEF